MECERSRGVRNDSRVFAKVTARVHLPPTERTAVVEQVWERGSGAQSCESGIQQRGLAGVIHLEVITYTDCS